MHQKLHCLTVKHDWHHALNLEGGLVSDRRSGCESANKSGEIQQEDTLENNWVLCYPVQTVQDLQLDVGEKYIIKI